MGLEADYPECYTYFASNNKKFSLKWKERGDNYHDAIRKKDVISIIVLCDFCT